MVKENPEMAQKAFEIAMNQKKGSSPNAATREEEADLGKVIVQKGIDMYKANPDAAKNAFNKASKWVKDNPEVFKKIADGAKAAGAGAVKLATAKDKARE